MASRLRSLLGKVGNRLRGKPSPPTIDPRFRKYGQEGRGAGTREVGYAHAPEKRDWDKVKPLTGNDIEGFLYEGKPLFVYSSNVASATYYPTDSKMAVGFLGGGMYLYSNVTMEEAYQFTQAQSKGRWVWDYLRVRGSRTAHRKPFTKIR